MFWDYVTFTIVIVIGLINIIWPQETVKITWAVRHNVDENGRKSLINCMRFLGVLIVLGCIIWLVSQFNK